MQASRSTSEFSDFSARLALFDIGEGTQRLLTTTWPIIRSCVPEGIDAYFESCKALRARRNDCCRTARSSGSSTCTTSRSS